MSNPTTVSSSTRKLTPAMIDTLRSLTEGQKIRLTQTVRVGRRLWTTTVNGTFRGLNYLATGVTTDRVPEDDVIVPVLHFTKENGELSSIAVDENSKVEKV
ncbi:hypothetical protein [Zavarzinella formosa]|uniref:hypothetical protein n=1 Tax=Zavarzinella formosa TaxID=360055 RepID=UPI00035C0FBA|nr:hypothetical protein [Zavarzinella formosa]